MVTLTVALLPQDKYQFNVSPVDYHVPIYLYRIYVCVAYAYILKEIGRKSMFSKTVHLILCRNSKFKKTYIILKKLTYIVLKILTKYEKLLKNLQHSNLLICHISFDYPIMFI